MKKILIIEDDPTIIQGLEDTFKFHGFEIYKAEDGKSGLELFLEKDPDLIILDIMMPGFDGYEICKRIRDVNKSVPIIMLTAKSRESDKLLGFELGADDYVTKPFSVRELVARAEAVLKRSARIDNQIESIKIGDAEVNFKNFELKTEKRVFQ